MAEHFDVVVVGAGISGASTAYYLRRKGVARVLLLDRAGAAAGGTGRSAAIVRQHYSTRLMARLARAAVDIFATMTETLGQDGGYRRVGYLFLVPPDQLEAARRNVTMQQGLGIKTEILLPDALVRPWLNLDGVAGAAFEIEGGYADPVQSTEAFVAAFQKLGGIVRLNCPARALIRNGDRVIGVSTDDGVMSCGTVINAAGPWAAPLAASAGLALEMRTVREQDTVWEARPGRPIPEHAISNAVDAIYLRPTGARRFIVGRGFPKDYVDVDPYNYKETVDEQFVAEVQGRLELRFPTMAGARLVHAYGALYDVTPDWYQFVGPRAGLAGYADFSGGSGHGFKEAPAIARELVDWLVDDRVAEDFRQFSHDRIAAGNLFVQSYGGNRG
ncbi:MAG: FAD-binding oxidoreductase, partial [Pseudomonadota bacterium]